MDAIPGEQVVAMAFKMLIPQDWIRQRPNMAKLPHLYNLDAAVGMQCPNHAIDVMLVQMLLWCFARAFNLWGRDPESYNVTGVHLGPMLGTRFPLDGIFTNRVLHWLFVFQDITSPNSLRDLTGKVEPIRSIASLSLPSVNTLAKLNLDLATSRAPPLHNTWLDMSSAPDVPGPLAQALRKPR